MVIKYFQILSFIAVVYLSILSCFAFKNYESMHLKKHKFNEIGFSLFYAAIFYFLLFLFISFYLNKNNNNINNINNQIIEMKENNLIIDEENQILN
jgi:Na+/melibiose symporter-like transporter